MNIRLLTTGTLALAALTACDSRLTGNEGNFSFSYQADDVWEDFNKPIAVGAMLDVEVSEVGTLQPITLSAASFDDVEVLDVLDISANVVTIQGMGDGSALLSVEGTTPAGEALSDSVNLLARVPEVSRLGHSCSLEADAAYLTGARVYVPFELEMDNGQPVIGYGYYPFASSDEALVTAATDWLGQQYAAFDTVAPGTLVIDSEVDDAQLAMTIIDAGQIDGVSEPIAGVWEDIDVGDTNAFYVHPSSAGLTVCQADISKTVISDTPEICAVQDSEPGSGADYEYGWFSVTGVAEGSCQYTVTFPDGNGGEGASASFSYPIEP